MRLNVKFLVERVEEIFDLPEPIVEIGSFQVPGQENKANIRPFFKKKKFIGCDIRKGMGVDRIENVENLSFSDDSIGTVLMLDTLEHVKDPWKALYEIWRVLMKEGYMLITSAMDFPIHDYPNDYWRFTPEIFNLMREKFLHKMIISWGNPIFPHTVIALGYNSLKQGEFKNKSIKLIQSLPEVYPSTSKRKIKLFLAKNLRMYETAEKLKNINTISFEIYSNGRKLLSDSIKQKGC